MSKENGYPNLTSISNGGKEERLPEHTKDVKIYYENAEEEELSEYAKHIKWRQRRTVIRTTGI